MANTTTCAKCGACTSVCPVYRVSGRESLTARGKVHLLENMPTDQRSRNFSDIFFQCLLCGACSDICPRGLDLTKMIVAARSGLPRSDAKHPVKKYLAANTLASPLLIKGATGLLRATASFIDKLPRDSGLRLKLRSSLPVDIEPSPPYLTYKKNTSAAQMAYFTGCTANFLRPQIGHDTDQIVEKYTSSATVAPKGQNCCGLAAHAAGDIATAKELARRNITTFLASEDSRNLPILTSCASCFSHLKSYAELLADDKDWRQKAASFSARVLEFSSWLVSNHEPPQYNLPTRNNIFYHDPCHLRFKHKIIEPPRQLIEKMTGKIPLEIEDGGQCCGMGGLFQISYPQQSQRIFSNLTEKIAELDIDTVTTSCSGCLLQLERGLADKTKIRVIHLVRLLAAAINKTG